MYGARARRREPPAEEARAEWWRGRTRQSALREAARPRVRRIQVSSDEEGGSGERQSERLRYLRRGTGGAPAAARLVQRREKSRRVAWSDTEDEDEGAGGDGARPQHLESRRSRAEDDRTSEVRQPTRSPEEGRAAETSGPVGCACEAGGAGGDARGRDAEPGNHTKSWVCDSPSKSPGKRKRDERDDESREGGLGSGEAGREPGGRASAWQADGDSQRTGLAGAGAERVNPAVGS